MSYVFPRIFVTIWPGRHYKKVVDSWRIQTYSISTMKAYKTIEQGSHGATYRNSMNTFTVYEISRYPRSSVLAGQQRRVWLDDFSSLAEAQAAYPDARFSGDTYRAPYLEHLPEEGDNDNEWVQDDRY